MAEAAIGAVTSLILIFRGFSGSGHFEDVVAKGGRGEALDFGTAVFFLIIAAAIGFAGYRLCKGLGWGRGPVVFINLLFIPVAYYMFSAGQLWLAAGTFIVAVATLVMLFLPASVRWSAQLYRS